MGEVILEETYKICPNGWSPERSYLLAKKIQAKLSTGVVLERYCVIKRWSAQGYGKEGIFTESLKGVEYTKGELGLIELNK